MIEELHSLCSVDTQARTLRTLGFADATSAPDPGFADATKKRQVEILNDAGVLHVTSRSGPAGEPRTYNALKHLWPDIQSDIAEGIDRDEGYDADAASEIQTSLAELQGSSVEIAEETEMDALWQARKELAFAMSAYRADLVPYHPGDVTVPISALPEILHGITAMAEDRDLLPVRDQRYDDYALRERVRGM
jgi:FAD/FMN-containing dehydrogenase